MKRIARLSVLACAVPWLTSCAGGMPAVTSGTGGAPHGGGGGDAGDSSGSGGIGSPAGSGGGGGSGAGGRAGADGASGAGGTTDAGTGGAAGAGTGGAAGGGGGATASAGGAAGTVGRAGAGGAAGGTGGGAGSAAGAGGRGGGAGAGGAAGRGGGTGGTGGSTPPNGCPVNLVGWAAVNADGTSTTTGGGSATPVQVTTFAELQAAVQGTTPRVILISGTIKTTDGGGSALSIGSNKTLVGADKSATIYGGINMSNVSNVIIRNLNIQGTWPNSGPDDTVASHTSHHIWYDHLNIWDSTDGSLDITNASDYETVSWTKFWYTSTTHPHRLASLNGSGGGDHPEDSRHLKATYHHNWWGQYVNERMPRVMYGKGHQFNNYFNSTGNLYCIGVGSFGSILVENNYFKDVKGPHVFMYDWHMYIAATGNIYDNTTGNKDTGLGGTRDTNDPALNAGVEEAAPFTPPYTYTLDKAADVPALVQKCAGPQ